MRDRELLPLCPDSEFFGRTGEIGRIFEAATGAEALKRSIFVSGPRWSGKTEILRRVHRRLFWEQSAVAPVYYRFKPGASAAAFASDFLRELARQYIAFRTRRADLFSREPSLCELEDISSDIDLSALSEAFKSHRNAAEDSDTVALLANALKAPALAGRGGVRVFLLLDDLGCAADAVVGEVAGGLSSGAVRFAAAGVKDFMGSLSQCGVEEIALTGLAEDEALSMLSDLCAMLKVDFDPEVLRYAVLRLEGVPAYLKIMAGAALWRGKGLSALKDFAGLYVEEITAGTIARGVAGTLDGGGPLGLKAVRLCLASGGHVSEERLCERLRVARQALRDSLSRMISHGLLDASAGAVKWTGGIAARDAALFLYETGLKRRSVDEFKAAFAKEVLKDGYGRGDKGSGRISEDVRAVLNAFNCQKAPRALFRKRADNAPVAIEEGEIALPETVGCFDSRRLEPSETGVDILIAHGFQNRRYDTGSEVVWLAGVKGASSPVNVGDVESFVRRCQMLKENLGAERLVRWMVADGFTPEALRRLDSEAVAATDTAQLSILKETLRERQVKDRGPQGEAPAREFEVVLPASSNAELVAAKAAEEVAGGMGFDANAVAQIKSAVIEACINAFEHSKFKYGKIFLKLSALSDRLVVSVLSKGESREDPARANDPATGGKNRNWGFDLMKGLMDEVRVERAGEGARVVLTKYLAGKGDARDGKKA